MTSRPRAPRVLRHSLFTLLLALLPAAAGCTTSSTPSPSASATRPSPSASATARASAAPTQAGVARYERGNCEFQPPRELRVECGFLVVPEDRARPTGRTIRLHVGVFSSRSQTPKRDPVIYLQGGPGGSTLDIAEQIIDRTPFLADRDVILIDQRGTGYSRPLLDCTEQERLFFDTLDDAHPRDRLTELDDRASEACLKRLSAQADPNAYSSDANAADIADLRGALGYDEWNLYGVSYGTRLALNTMRDHPEGIRSVILDSVYPPQIDSQAGLARNADRALSLVFQQCAADAECAATYPRLDQVFSEVVARLNAQPAPLRMSDWTKKQNHDAIVNGDLVVSVLFEMLYDTDSVPTIPRVIYELRNGDYDAISQSLSYSLETMRHIAEAMYQAVECGEEAPFTTPEAIRAAAVGVRAEIASYFAYESQAFLESCREIWNVRPQPAIENQAVTSAIPTLLLAGEFDPITPPSMAEAAAQGLSTSSLHVFPGVGHGVVGSRYCAESVVRDFLDDPASRPDSACVSVMPKVRFSPPDAPRQPAAPTPYRDDQAGFALTLASDWVVVSPRDAAEPGKLDQLLFQFPEHGQFVRDAAKQLREGVVLAAHDRRAGTDILATTTPTLLVYRAPGAMVGRSVAQIARDQVAFLKGQSDVVGDPVARPMTLGGTAMQEIVAQYRAWHLGREIRIVLVNYLAASGSDLYFFQFARPSDAGPDPVPGFRATMGTLELAR